MELARFGFVEGQNLTVFPSFIGRDGTTAETAASNLLPLRVDAIYVVAGTAGVQAARLATSTIPIVMLTSSDPVGDGLVASLRQPGGNVTGNAIFGPELLAKRLQILVEITDRPRRVAFLTTTRSPYAFRPKNQQYLAAAAQRMDTSAQVFLIDSIDEIDSVIAEIGRLRLPVLVDTTSLFYIHAKRLGELVVQNRLPAIGDGRRYAEAGFLASYGQDYHDLARKCARYVARIFRGADPKELPVELATKFEMFLNLRTAATLGVTVPRSLIFGATAVIR
ncbi:ABC transporter substrate-binding protein [Variovorax sp. J22R115]|uniref:ABC transporter substrate-binding protein n=1 Tax=Variovorax sp. J22R115 TaxID=3053509 RepID=UPI002578307D|nr:ABC transporter substrate-binding protein [Variovorax sp. J22R115]MDM0047736.1 ABC transporter substrate-binding protein [Variovorax sp. J22R115]